MIKVNLTVTDAAKSHLLNIISRHQNGKGLRLLIKRSGCSGFMYAPKVVEDIPVDDIALSFGDELTIYVPGQDVSLVDGTEIALIDKELGQRQIVFNNPNAVNACGCGESFSVRENSEDDDKANKS